MAVPRDLAGVLLSARALLRVFREMSHAQALFRVSWGVRSARALLRVFRGVVTGLLAGTKREAVKHPRGVGAQTSSDLFATRRPECRNRLRLNVEIRLDYVQNLDILLAEALLRSR